MGTVVVWRQMVETPEVPTVPRVGSTEAMVTESGKGPLRSPS